MTPRRRRRELLAAFEAWRRRNAGAHLQFRFPFTLELPLQPELAAQPLSVLETWATDEPSRAFVRELDAATRGRCTLADFIEGVLPKVTLRASKGGSA